MVTHEPDMAAYAHRQVHFLDGRIASDVPNAHPTLVAPDAPAAPAPAAAVAQAA
jgi:ABC-type lipoprotein export system ATPase subunit